MELPSNPIQSAATPVKPGDMPVMPSANNAVANGQVDQTNNLSQIQAGETWDNSSGFLVANNPGELSQSNTLNKIGGLQAMPSANDAVAGGQVDQTNNLSRIRGSFSDKPNDLVSKMGNRIDDMAAQLSSGDPLKGFAQGLAGDFKSGMEMSFISVDATNVLSSMANLQTALSQVASTTGAMINSPNLQAIV